MFAIDPQRMFLDAIGRLLGREEGLCVVGVDTDVERAIESCRRSNPDVILLDPARAGTFDRGMIGDVVHGAPEAAVVVVSSVDPVDGLPSALAAGARAFVLKTRGIDELIAAIRSASVGGIVISTEDLRRSDRPSRTRETFGKVGPSSLTARELETLAQLSQGRSTGEAAAALHISPLTVRSHVKSILAKLGAHSKLEAVTLAIGYGLVPVRRPA